MQREALIDLYQRNKLPQTDLEEALDFLNEMENFIITEKDQFPLEMIGTKELDHIIEHLVIEDMNTIKYFVILMRYFQVTKRNDLFIHMTKFTGSIGVMESILKRLQKMVDQKTYEQALAQIIIPKLGTKLNEMPRFTNMLMTYLEKMLTSKQIETVLSNNHHHIPKEAFIEEKVYYESAETLDEYLKDLHLRKVNELESCLQENRVWYEQNITREVIDFVKNNQEILSAIRKDDKLYITKIPYDTKAYLEANTPEDKKYHVCHCPFVKSIFLDNKYRVSPTWCYCSGGFSKVPFEVIFDQELTIELIDTPLKGDELCRFAIPLDHIDYKR